MVLIAILLCLALQRFANLGCWFQVSLFELYLKSLNPLLIKLNEWLSIVLIIAPILFFLALIQFIFSRYLFGLFNLIFATSILFICMDARDLKNKLTAYFSALEKNDTQEAANAVVSFISDSCFQNQGELCRNVTKTILLTSFQKMFAGMFWFIVFGVYGITTYFLITLLQKNTTKSNYNYIGISILAARIKDVLDWIPSRLTGFSYAFVGNFNNTIGYCKEHLITTPLEIKNFIINTGLSTLDTENDLTKVNQKENRDALTLVDRVLTIWLVALAVMLLCIWF